MTIESNHVTAIAKLTDYDKNSRATFSTNEKYKI